MALSGPLQLWHLSLLLHSHPELHWNTVGSSKTNEIVLFGGGDNFQMRQRDYLIKGWGGGGEYCQARQMSSSCLEVGWGWRIFSSETNDLMLFGGGVGLENIFKQEILLFLISLVCLKSRVLSTPLLGSILNLV